MKRTMAGMRAAVTEGTYIFLSGGPSQFARVLEPHLEAEGPRLGAEEKELPRGPPDSTEDCPEPPGPLERRARSSKQVRAPVSS